MQPAGNVAGSRAPTPEPSDPAPSAPELSGNGAKQTSIRGIAASPLREQFTGPVDHSAAGTSASRIPLLPEGNR